jgi:hypothetical protein
MEFDINNLFSKAFGYQPPENFHIDDTAAEKAISGSLGSPYYANDLLGREMFLPVVFTLGIKEYLIPFAVISINAKKIIVSTPMPERGGEVIELISISSYGINIKGIVITDDNSFPEDDIKDLQQLFLANESILLRSVLTDIFLSPPPGQKGSDQRVVITEMKWPAVAGTENARPFEMDCMADTIFELTDF